MNLVILGGGGHAAVVADLIQECGDHDIMGFVDDDEKCVLPGVSHLGPLGDLSTLPSSCEAIALGVGNAGLRTKWLSKAKQRGLACPSFVHSSATVSRYATLGEGIVIMAGAVVQSGAVLGDGTIVNTGASVDHNTIVGSFVHIAPGARLAGNVRVGESAFIGMMSAVIEGCSVGSDAMVAAGAVVTHDVAHGQKVAGVPAKVMILRDKS